MNIIIYIYISVKSLERAEAWVGEVQGWALQVLQPVLAALPQLRDLKLRLRRVPWAEISLPLAEAEEVEADADELWLTAVASESRSVAVVDKSLLTGPRSFECRGLRLWWRRASAT